MWWQGLHAKAIEVCAPGRNGQPNPSRSMFGKPAISCYFLAMPNSGQIVSPRANRTRLPHGAKLHDKQSERDHREIRIDKVGVRGLRFPIQVRDKAHAVQNTVATIGMFVDLPKEFKGTHMSRFLEVLNAHGNIIHVENITDILYALQNKFRAATSQ